MIEYGPGEAWIGDPDTGAWIPLGKTEGGTVELAAGPDVSGFQPPLRSLAGLTATATGPLTPQFARFVMGPAWLIWLAPDGSCWQGAGRTLTAAEADARRKWRRWKHHSPRQQRITRMHRAYHHRRRARQRRNR